MGKESFQYATLDEVLDAIEQLDQSANLRLYHFGNRCAFGTCFGAEDLVQEALKAAIALKRRWRLDLPFVEFVQGAMKSIAYNDRNSLRARSEVTASELVFADSDDDPDDVLAVTDEESRAPPVDVQLIEAAEKEALVRDVQALYDRFADDDEVTYILMGIQDGLRGSEIQEFCGLDKTAYESARKRLRRGADKMLIERGRK